MVRNWLSRLACAGLVSGLVSGVLTASAYGEALAFTGLEVLEQPAPARTVVLFDREGEAVSLDGAPVTVLNFWATWCRPCVAELPTLLALDEQLGAQGLRVVAASLDRSYAQIDQFWAQKGWGDNLEVALDDKGSLFRDFSADELGARGVPYTAILNSDGEIISWYAGDADWASAPVLAYFRGLLEAASE